MRAQQVEQILKDHLPVSMAPFVTAHRERARQIVLVVGECLCFAKVLNDAAEDVFTGKLDALRPLLSCDDSRRLAEMLVLADGGGQGDSVLARCVAPAILARRISEILSVIGDQNGTCENG